MSNTKSSSLGYCDESNLLMSGFDCSRDNGSAICSAGEEHGVGYPYCISEFEILQSGVIILLPIDLRFCKASQ